MPVNEPAKRLRASDEERDYVLYLLQQAHAAGRLDVDELSERQDRTFSVKYADEFVPLLEDLPEGAEVVAVLRPQPAPEPRRANPLRFAAPVFSGNRSVAILSGKDIMLASGTTSYTLLSFMGGDTVNISNCMGPGVTLVIESQAVLGGATIKVPLGVHIVDESSNVVGGNTIRKNARGDGSNGTLVLRGNSILGGNTVKLA
ncbi:DUF1707 domain-containing protein [uncultured Tessaracoccus sp.]|uniref:DUF1707 SHOCT-like domain-containing protein n=1 Tax=uncultured Tessaracoccus sp. TaxID=905023 RepID=UPI00260CA569|nr:DUF1707 domain-containing protein [uncultured Tessaracoccus sp.]